MMSVSFHDPLTEHTIFFSSNQQNQHLVLPMTVIKYNWLKVHISDLLYQWCAIQNKNYMKEETRCKKVDTAFQKSGYLKKEMNNIMNQESA